MSVILPKREKDETINLCENKKAIIFTLHTEYVTYINMKYKSYTFDKNSCLLL